MSILYVTNEMIQDCYNTLSNELNNLGIHEYSQELFSQEGISLRLESSLECVSKTVIDTEAKAERTKRNASRENKIRLAAASVGLTVESYAEKQREKSKANRIKQLVEKLGINIDSATVQVEAEDSIELKTLKTEFYQEKHPETINEVEGFSTSNIPDAILDKIPMNEFNQWRYKKESLLNNEPDPTKEIVVIKSVTPLHIVYSFNESVVGIQGFDIIAKNSYKLETSLPSVETFKALFKEYINSDEFKKGMAFISRIAGNDLSIKLK